MSALIIVGGNFTTLDMNDSCHLYLRILSADQSRMRRRSSFSAVSISFAEDDVPFQVNDIWHINICGFAADIIAVDHIIDVFGCGILIIAAIVIGAVFDISLVHTFFNMI